MAKINTVNSTTTAKSHKVSNTKDSNLNKFLTKSGEALKKLGKVLKEVFINTVKNAVDPDAPYRD
ncbi:MAG: hypothetical protein ABIH00_04595 [Armatimonadota bacterium]